MFLSCMRSCKRCLAQRYLPPPRLPAADASGAGPRAARLRWPRPQAAGGTQAAHPAPAAGRCAGCCHGRCSRRASRAAAGSCGGKRSRHSAPQGQRGGQPGGPGRRVHLSTFRCPTHHTLSPLRYVLGDAAIAAVTPTGNGLPALQDALPTSRTTGSAAEYCLGGGEPSYESLDSPLAGAAGARASSRNQAQRPAVLNWSGCTQHDLHLTCPGTGEQHCCVGKVALHASSTPLQRSRAAWRTCLCHSRLTTTGCMIGCAGGLGCEWEVGHEPACWACECASLQLPAGWASACLAGSAADLSHSAVDCPAGDHSLQILARRAAAHAHHVCGRRCGSGAAAVAAGPPPSRQPPHAAAAPGAAAGPAAPAAAAAVLAGRWWWQRARVGLVIGRALHQLWQWRLQRTGHCRCAAGEEIGEVRLEHLPGCPPLQSICVLLCFRDMQTSSCTPSSLVCRSRVASHL